MRKKITSGHRFTEYSMLIKFDYFLPRYAFSKRHRSQLAGQRIAMWLVVAMVDHWTQLAEMTNVAVSICQTILHDVIPNGGVKLKIGRRESVLYLIQHRLL